MSIPPNSLYNFGPQAPGVLSAPRLAAAPGPAPTGPVNPAVAGIHVPLWLLGAIGAWFLFMQPGARRRNPGKRWDYEYGPRYESAEDFRGGGWGAWDKLNQRFVGGTRMSRGQAREKVMRLRRGERLPARYRNPNAATLRRMDRLDRIYRQLRQRGVPGREAEREAMRVQRARGRRRRAS